MKKLYNNKRKIYPSPPVQDLSLLPVAIATLAAALAPEDKQVLAYLLSCSGTTTTTTTTNTIKQSNSVNFSGDIKPTGAGGRDHLPQFGCNCFTCYTSYWVRWDASPNRQLIHEIIDAYEDGLIHSKKNKRERRKNKLSSPHAPSYAAKKVSHAQPEMEEKGTIRGGGDQDDWAAVSSEKGSVEKIVSFIGEKIWGVWGI